MANRLVAAVQSVLTKHRIAGPVVAAVSGGADSVALLLALREVGCEVVVAHANHGLRGAESDSDEAFVRDLAGTLSLPFQCTRLTIPANENLEAAARRLRYEWLEEIAGDIVTIATGHTADDQAETVLHRLVRGTGLQGLRGIAAILSAPSYLTTPLLRGRVRVGGEESNQHSAIPIPPTPALPLRGGGGKSILRPMLAVTRADVLDYLASLDQPFRVDSSNADQRFTRNRIRHELLPLLRSFNPEIVTVLGRFAEQASETFDFVEAEATYLLSVVERPRAGAMLIFDRATLETAAPYLVRELFRLVWRREGWPMDAMTFDHWHRAASLATGDYPAGIHIKTVGPILQILRRS